MSDVRPYLWLIPVLPLCAAALIAFVGPGLLRRHSHWPCVLAIAASCVLSFFVLSAVHKLDKVPEPGEAGSVAGAEPPGAEAPNEGPRKTEYVEQYYRWAHVGNLDVGFTLRADG